MDTTVHRYTIPARTGGYFDFAGYRQAIVTREQRRIVDHERCYGTPLTTQMIESWLGLAKPGQLKGYLQRYATNLVAAHPLPHYFAAVCIGGKGRVLGIHLARLIAAELARTQPLSAVEERFVLYGADNPINLSGVLLRKTPPLLNARKEELNDDCVQPTLAAAIATYVQTGADVYIDGLRAYFAGVVTDLLRRAAGRPATLYLLDDQMSMGLTKTYATQLLTTLLDQMAATTGQPAPLQVDYRYMNLAPSWDHMPGHFLREQLETLLPRPRLLADLTGLVLPLEVINARRSRDQLAAPQEFNRPRFRAFCTHFYGDLHDYVVRGGLHNQDEHGEPLINLHRCPGDRLRFHADLGHGPLTVEVDLYAAVNHYNSELAALLAPG